MKCQIVLLKLKINLWFFLFYSGISTFGLFIENVNKKIIPSFIFFLLSSDDLEMLDSFFIPSLIEISNCASGDERSISGSSGVGDRISDCSSSIEPVIEILIHLFIFFLLSADELEQ
jgi:hypothetical protein